MNLQQSSTGGEESRPAGKGGLFAAGGIVGAVLASTCCILPLALVSLGVGGAWMGNLTALAPYQPWFAGAAFASLATGFWRVYVTPKKQCETGASCRTARSEKFVKAALWGGTALAISALAVQNLLPLIMDI